ncbi:WD repeat-containing protein 3 isoform X2 [Hydra vulgaris]|uniref:WD repeat-containing protein 3 isoform X2 n=1 Tax=Hydra vulgaris TaxID=6087 RepID=A0ABM4BI04_HYDVU
MPISKTYKRYAPLCSFGVIGSGRSNVIIVNPSQTANSNIYGASAVLENVCIWDMRKAEMVMMLKGVNAEVTALAKAPGNSSMIAVGYSDGAIKMWNLKTNISDISFSGHKSAVTCLSFDITGTKLVSGSNDTDVIVWDIVGETGLYRLKGHKGMVTSCQFMTTQNVLITSSKDMLVKFWDLDTQHCFLTLVGHKSEVWQTCLLNDETRLITGCGDSELRVYKLISEENKEVPLSCELIGSIIHQGKGRITTLKTDASRRFLVCHGIDSSLELFKVYSESEAQASFEKRIKKAQKKQRKKGDEQKHEELSIEREITDEIKKLHFFQLKQKIKTCDITVDDSGEIKLIVLFTNNSFGYYKVQSELNKCQLQSLLSNMGHRTDVRTLSLNGDATMILSGSGESVKIWNRSSQKCIRTLDSEYCLCSCFVPGDRHAIVGTKSGKLQLFDISAGILLETVDAHEQPIWSIALSPDKRGFITGSADHDVKFWEFELIKDEEYSLTSTRLGMTHTQTLKMSEEILAVKFSPDGRLLAVSLLDSTVKVFFTDTLKFFLSIYGHKFPVLCMDISLDSTLLITGSADKNIKIWGLDFGDCHKSIFAHDDSITGVQFVSKTHYFFSISKDKTLKYWDADKFENIMTLKGHHAEIWALAVSTNGEFLVTGSHDKSIRIWERTEELLVLDEEREQEREEADEMTLIERGSRPIPGETEGEAENAGKKTIETVKAAERIMEAIQLFKEEQEKRKENIDSYDPHPILKAFGENNPKKYVLSVLKKVKRSELDESLLVLPFTYVVDLLELINYWLQKNWEVELCTRCLTYLLKIHHNQITTSHLLLTTVESLKENTSRSVRRLKDEVGFNRAGLRFLLNQIELKKNITFFEDAIDKSKKKKKTKKIMAFT